MSSTKQGDSHFSVRMSCGLRAHNATGVANTPEVFGTALGGCSKGAQLLSAVLVGQAQGCAAKQQGCTVAAAGQGSFRFSTESSAALAIASSETRM